ncbi:MAG: helix-turn-helix domain-containing protein [Desulfobacterales bacterium]
MSKNVEITGYLTEKQIAEHFPFSVSTLQKWRHMNKGPAYHKIGRMVLYKYEDVEGYLHQRKVMPANR